MTRHGAPPLGHRSRCDGHSVEITGRCEDDRVMPACTILQVLCLCAVVALRLPGQWCSALRALCHRVEVPAGMPPPAPLHHCFPGASRAFAGERTQERSAPRNSPASGAGRTHRDTDRAALLAQSQHDSALRSSTDSDDGGGAGAASDHCCCICVCLSLRICLPRCGGSCGSSCRCGCLRGVGARSLVRRAAHTQRERDGQAGEKSALLRVHARALCAVHTKAAATRQAHCEGRGIIGGSATAV